MIQTYDGFDYSQRLHDGQVQMMLNGKPRAIFRDIAAFKAFCDGANGIIEKVVLKDIRLHLTGCKRCYRSTQNPTEGINSASTPCATGANLFRTLRENSIKVVEIMLQQLDTVKLEAQKENEAQKRAIQ